MRYNWDVPLNKKEEETMKEFIQYTYDGFIKWGGDPNKFSNDDRNFDHILAFMIRDITRIIGELKNLKISINAKEIIGECNCWKNIERAKELHPGEIVLDHNPTAKSFFDEFKMKKINKESFTYKDADRWLNEAFIVAITKKEDQLLTNKGYMKDRPLDAYDRVGIKTIEVWGHK